MILKKVLKYINSIPFKFTAKHYQVFGDSSSSLKNNSLNNVESWDALRKSHPHYSIADSREKWLEAVELKVVKDGQDGGLLQRAKDVSNLLNKEKISSVFSAGVGGAGLEYQIKKQNPEIQISCSEYSEVSVGVLKKVFIESGEIILFDILKGDWQGIKDKYIKDRQSVLLMYRLDAGFTDTEWEKIFEQIHKSGIENVIYIPTNLLTMLSLWNRKSRELKWLVKREPVSFAGYNRTRKTFQSYWSNLYTEKELKFGGLSSFFLKRK